MPTSTPRRLPSFAPEAASGTPPASSVELRSATAAIAATREERISNVLVSLKPVALLPFSSMSPGLSVETGSTVSSEAYTPWAPNGVPVDPGYTSAR